MLKTDIKTEIISIGDELLIGQVVNTNAAWMGKVMNDAGFSIQRVTTIADDKDDIFNALDLAINNNDIVLITGGLGPTNDDITKKTLADYFNSPLVMNEVVLKKVTHYFRSRNKALSEVNKQQAMVPQNCTVIGNEMGTAPGMLFNIEGKIIISMPGVPYEMKELMIKDVIPFLKKKFQSQAILHKTILTQGIGESDMAELIKDWESQLPPNLSLAYLPKPGMVRLRLSGTDKNESKLTNDIDKHLHQLQKIIPQYIYGYDDDSLERIIGDLLSKQNSTLSTAESYTGGKIASTITNISGASQYFKGSIIAYSNEIKENILNVNHIDIQELGAVSQSVAEQMANNVRKLLNTDYSISTTGIAGPTGGSIEKPIGTVWIAISSEQKTISKSFQLGNIREKVADQSVQIALNMLRNLLLNNMTD